LEQSFCRAQGALGFVDRRHEIVTFRPEVGPGEIGDTSPVSADRLGRGTQLGSRGTTPGTHAVNDRAAPVTSPIVVAGRVPVRDDLRALERYHSPRVDVPVRLNVNESPYPPPSDWRDELDAAMATVDWHRYPDRSAHDLRATIANWHGVRAEQVFAANGSNEVLQTLLLTYGGRDRTMVTFEPTYQLHSHIGRITGTTVVEGERNDDFTLDAGVAREVIGAAQPMVTFLCSPNNPTGLVESPSVVDAVLEAAPGLVVVDEAYAQFADWTALELVDDQAPLVIVRTFSKTWSMAGARLGYLVGPEWVVAALEQVVLPYHLDAAKQLAGTLALKHVDEMDARVKQIVAERERLAEALQQLPVETFPSGANFLLFRSPDGPAVWQGLVQRGVLVRDCSSWPRLTNCLRVTVGTPEENDWFLEALREVLGEAGR
jgi:histidinol-phosphate aminotransferase